MTPFPTASRASRLHFTSAVGRDEPRFACPELHRDRLEDADAVERMLAKLSARRYPIGLEPVRAEVTCRPRSTSHSAVSRRFVKANKCALGELLARDLSGSDLAALIVDGVHCGDHLCVVALRIGIGGVKYSL